MNMMLLLVVIILQYSAYQTYLRPNDPLYRHIATSYQRPQPVYRSMEECHPFLSERQIMVSPSSFSIVIKVQWLIRMTGKHPNYNNNNINSKYPDRLHNDDASVLLTSQIFVFLF